MIDAVVQDLTVDHNQEKKNKEILQNISHVLYQETTKRKNLDIDFINNNYSK
jgi:hypothetical protein